MRRLIATLGSWGLERRTVAPEQGTGVARADTFGVLVLCTHCVYLFGGKGGTASERERKERNPGQAFIFAHPDRPAPMTPFNNYLTLLAWPGLIEKSVCITTFYA